MNTTTKTILLLIVCIFHQQSLIAQDVSTIKLVDLSDESCPWLLKVVSEFENYLLTVVHSDGYRPKVNICETTMYQLRDASLSCKILIVLYHPKVDFSSTVITGFFLLDESSASVRLLNISEIPKAGIGTETTPYTLFGLSH